MRATFEIAGTAVASGTRALVDLDLPGLTSHTRLSMPVHVVHGRREGPRLFVSAAIHGDQVNGVEIVRRILETRALRYNEIAIRAGVNGVLNVLRALDMVPSPGRRRRQMDPFVARSSSWVRAPVSGMLRHGIRLGAMVAKGEVLGHVSDPYTGDNTPVHAHARGVIIGRAEIPMAQEGEALFHIARFRDDAEEVAEQVEMFHQAHAEEAFED
jgi:predicted deacylase